MAEIAVPEIDPDEVIDFMTVDTTDFGSFAPADQIRHLEVEGFVVLPDMLDVDHIARLKAELADMPMRPKPYSEYLTTGQGQPQFFSRAVAELIGHPPMVAFLKALMGPDIVFTLCAKAGSAVLIPVDLFPATHPNADRRPRELIQFGYRPAWAGPIQPLEEWDAEWVASAPEQAKLFLQSPNTTGNVWQLEHKPKGMQIEAPGISPSRWGD